MFTGRDRHRFQMLDHCRAVVPRHPVSALDHVVALERADRDEHRLAGREVACEILELGDDLAEHVLAVVDQVHLVYRDDEVRDPEQRRDERVASRLRQHALARIDQHDREMCRRRAGRHVARILFVSRRVGDDELAFRRREVAVGDINGDSLLALGPQSVGQQREVNSAARPVDLRVLDRCELVFVDALRVVEQPADQGGLAVVHTACRGEPQQLLLLLVFDEFLDRSNCRHLRNTLRAS